MTFIHVMSVLIGIGGAVSTWLFRRGGIYNPIEPQDTPPEPQPVPEPKVLLWDTPKHAWHSVRVLCDNEGLSYSEKNLICAVIYGESEFKNTAICRNKDKQGNVTSTDWGICQINDYWHTGEGKTFPNAEYVVAHPEEAVKFMLKMYRLGLLRLWVAYSSGRYQQFIPKTSKMWTLA